MVQRVPTTPPKSLSSPVAVAAVALLPVAAVVLVVFVITPA
jgi:hypothetical protein